MKKFFICAAFLIMSLAGSAQQNVTKFMGIPVDGSKEEVVRQLLAKGFVRSASDRDILTGEFNGEDVDIHVVTQNNKVWRIMVEDKTYRDETQIRIRFNNLCRQFEKNDKYTKFSDRDYTLPEDEDISYNITVKSKQYQASYYQQYIDTVAIQSAIMELKSKYTDEQWENPTEEMTELRTNLIAQHSMQFIEETFKNSVWFTIHNYRMKYHILLYYDNERNKADGSDL